MKNNKNLLKGIGTLLIFIIFGYYSYQDAVDRRMLERSLEDKASSPQRDFAEKGTSSSSKQRNYEYNSSLSGCKNEVDTFNSNLDEYLSDPEDEISYPPEIFDALIDDDEKELIENEIDY